MRALYHTEGEDILIKGSMSTDYKDKPYVEISVGKHPLSFTIFLDVTGLQKLSKVVERLTKEVIKSED